MPNVLVPAAAPGLPLETRRMFLAAGSASAVFGALAAKGEAGPASSELLALIDAHRRADAAVDDAYRVHDAGYLRFLDLVEPLAAEGAYFDPLRLDASREKFEREAWILELALKRATTFAQGESKRGIAAASGDFLQAFRAAFEGLCARTAAARRSSGFEAAAAALDRAEKIERAALVRLCAYPCASLEDVRAMAAYLVPIDGALEEEHIAALLCVFAGLPAAVAEAL